MSRGVLVLLFLAPLLFPLAWAMLLVAGVYSVSLQYEGKVGPYWLSLFAGDPSGLSNLCSIPTRDLALISPIQGARVLSTHVFTYRAPRGTAYPVAPDPVEVERVVVEGEGPGGWTLGPVVLPPFLGDTAHYAGDILIPRAGQWALRFRVDGRGGPGR